MLFRFRERSRSRLAAARLFWLLLPVLAGGLEFAQSATLLPVKPVKDEKDEYCPLSDAPVASGQLRPIKVQLVGDRELFRQSQATARVESALKEVSAEFERLFSLSLVSAGWFSWKADHREDQLQELAETLSLSAKGRRAEIILAVTGRSNLRSEYSGSALLKSSLIAIIYTPDEEKLCRLIKHELGHIFGAVHVPEPGSVMSCFGGGDNFDRYNLEIIKLARERSFEPSVFPFPAEVQTSLEKVYLQIREKILGDSRLKSLFSASMTAEAGEEVQCLNDVFLMLAQLELEKNNYDRSLSFIEEALIINPGDLDAMNLQAISLRQAGRIQEAVSIYKIILQIRPDFSEALYNLGLALSELGQLEEAEKVYLRAIRINPDLAPAYHNLGDLYLKQGRLDEAEKQFLKAIEFRPGYVSAYVNLGEIYRRKGDKDRAREYAEKALSLKPDSGQARNLLAHILRDSGKAVEALDAYQQVLAGNPTSAQAYYNLGVSLTDVGQWEEAEKSFETALKIDPNLAEGYGGLGLCALQRGEVDKAIQLLVKARNLGFKAPALSLNLSYAYLNKKDWLRAEQEARQAVEVEPGLATGYNNLGIALAQQNKLEEARVALEKALKIDPRDRQVLINLAMVELSLQNEGRALELFLRALAIDPQNSQNGLIYNNLAVIYFHLEKYELSWEFVQKALQAGFKVDESLINNLIKNLK